MPHSTTNSLQAFIAHARSKGMDHQTIRMLLLSAGWKERDVASAIGAEGLDVPVPMPVDAGGARDAFFHLLTFAGLYTTVISTLVLLYTYINRWLPDPALEPYVTDDTYRTGVRWSLAALIVAYPIFLWISKILLREMRLHVEKGSSGVRRWLTYLTLFVAASVLMGDLMTLIYQLLNGEVTLRFLIKVIVVFLAAGGVFIYYFQALRSSIMDQAQLHRTFGIISTVVVVLVLVYGFILSGSPAAERQRRIDDQRLSDIRIIAESTLDYVYNNKRWNQPTPTSLERPLPPNLDVLSLETLSTRVPLIDPDGVPYVYSVKDRTHFEVCSAFAYEDTDQYAPFWDHPAGEHCFSFDALQPNLP